MLDPLAPCVTLEQGTQVDVRFTEAPDKPQSDVEEWFSGKVCSEKLQGADFTIDISPDKESILDPWLPEDGAWTTVVMVETMSDFEIRRKMSKALLATAIPQESSLAIRGSDERSLDGRDLDGRRSDGRRSDERRSDGR